MEKKPNRDRQPAEIEKIKEILFGSNIEDIENRFSMLEGRISDEANQMLNTFRNDFARLRQTFDDEIAGLKKMIAEVREKAAETENRFEQENRESGEKFQLHLKNWKEKNAEIDRELNAHEKKIQHLQEIKLDTSRFVTLIESVLKKIKPQ